jgi:hypothetical protein
MYRTIRFLLPAVAGLLLLASCHSVPKHARFIPKDALVVLGVHTGEMRKDLAWSAITGSSLLEEMRKAAGDQVPQMLKDAENAGIDFGSTLYFYSKPDTRFEGGSRMAVVLPVSDAKKVTAYIQKHAPGVAITTVKGRSEALIGENAYIGWNDEALIAMNTIMETVAPESPVSADTGMAALEREFLSRFAERRLDSAATAAEMDIAFSPAKDAAITDNSHFRELENAGHDITMWVSYGSMLDAYGSRSGMDMMALAMGNTVLRGSAMAAGFDFEKGRVEGEMRYYASDSMRGIMKEFAKENVDPDMLKRLPAGGLNFAAGYHLAPQAVRMMLDRMGVTGMANMALMEKGMSIDDVLGAFTGDMVLSLNNFRVETKMQEIDSAMQRDFGLQPQPYTSPDVDFVYAMKIADKAKMAKLMSTISGFGVLQQTAPNTYAFAMAPAGGPTLVVGDKYVAISSNDPGAQAFLKESAGAMPEAMKKEIDGHPAGMWADVRSFMNGARELSSGTPSDSAAFNTLRNLLTTVTANGGEFRNNATEYHMTVSFMNKEEHSLVQLLHLAQQLAALNHKEDVALR